MASTKPIVKPTLERIELRFSDLTGRQALDLERAIGVPLSRFSEHTSDVLFVAACRSVVEGAPVDAYLNQFKARDLLDSVSIVDEGEDDDPGNG